MSTTVRIKARATVEDLHNVPEHGKAEIINGRLVRLMSTGKRPNRVSSRIWRSLDDYEQAQGGGVAVADNAGFIVQLPNRDSFSPDAAWYPGGLGAVEDEMDFFAGAPAFAAEVRSKNDYGKEAERQIAAKRLDYFYAGTLVVWDVDIHNTDVVKCYQHDAPDQPRVFRRGEVADAEPAVPGWRLAVDELFR